MFGASAGLRSVSTAIVPQYEDITHLPSFETLFGLQSQDVQTILAKVVKNVGPVLAQVLSKSAYYCVRASNGTTPSSPRLYDPRAVFSHIRSAWKTDPGNAKSLGLSGWQQQSVLADRIETAVCRIVQRSMVKGALLKHINKKSGEVGGDILEYNLPDVIGSRSPRISQVLSLLVDSRMLVHDRMTLSYDPPTREMAEKVFIGYISRTALIPLLAEGCMSKGNLPCRGLDKTF